MKPTNKILNRLKEKYNDVDVDGWGPYLNIKTGGVRNGKIAPFHALQQMGEKALRDFPECMSSGEITNDEEIYNTIMSLK